jgi:hypothetical protein
MTVRFTSPATGERQLEIESETATTVTLYHRSDNPDDALVTAGFTCEECETGRSWVNDYTPEIFYAHRLVIEKADPRLT